MADSNFLKKLVEFDKEHISDKILSKLKVYIDHKDFDPIKVEKVSKVCKSMCLWVRAMDDFSRIYKVVEPKIKRHRTAEMELKNIMIVLKQKQSELAEIEAKIQSLKDVIDVKSGEFKLLQDNVNLTSNRLNRAGRLTSALSEEEIRWNQGVSDLTKELWAIPGDTLISSAYVAYLGAFSMKYRENLSNEWIEECKKCKIPSSLEFKFINILGESYEIQQWNEFGLPKDDISTENGIIIKNAIRWPLIIDPQEQANRWIRNMERSRDLKIIKVTDLKLIKTIELCVRQGIPLLIEEIGETIDPSLNSIMKREIITQSGRFVIKLGDTFIDYDSNFRLYMTTKLTNPHYQPEICIQVTLINFLVTSTGLEDQLLSEIISIELPELEKQRSDLIKKINADRQQLLSLEDKVLRLLFSSEGNILDDEELVETLNEAKGTSDIISSRLIDTEQTEIVITGKREMYRSLAIRGATIYFVVDSLSEIDSMYQNSLKYFIYLFSLTIKKNQEKMELNDRLNFLMNAEVLFIYKNISRGLFENHKLIFSFLLAVAICRERNELTIKEFEFLIKGPVNVGGTDIKEKKLTNLNDYQWKCCVTLEKSFPNFQGICDELNKDINFNIGDYNFVSFVL